MKEGKSSKQQGKTLYKNCIKANVLHTVCKKPIRRNCTKIAMEYKLAISDQIKRNEYLIKKKEEVNKV